MPLVFCRAPTFEHLPPLDAASTRATFNPEAENRHKKRTPTAFLRQFILQNLMRTIGGDAGNRKQSGKQPCPPQPTNPLPNKKMNHINFKQIYSNLATKPAQATKFVPKALRTLSSDLGLWAF
jgi:hypothetical protein